MDSPDPLALSPTPTPMKRNFRKENSSPSKSFIMNTPSGPGASPWKIKVTVEAQPADENAGTPSRKTRSRTTTIPLKGGDGSSPVKNRGRPRKSEPITKRAGTPARKRRSIVNLESALTEREAEVTDPTFDPKPKRGRGRPRKSIIVQQVEDPTSIIIDAPEEDSITVAHPEDSLGKINEPPQLIVVQNTVIAETEPSTKSAPRRKSSRKSVKGRQPTPVKPHGWDNEDHTPVPQSSPQKSTSTGNDPEVRPEAGNTLDLEERGQTGQQLPPESTVTTNSLEEERHHGPDLTPEDEDEEHVSLLAVDIGDETILRSEDFSMVSIESLPSMQEHTHLPTPSASHTSGSKPTSPAAFNKELAHRRSGEAARTPLKSTASLQAESKNIQISHSSTLDGSAINKLSRDVTPSYMPSSPPSMPPALPTPQIFHAKASTPSLQRVVKAGMALQGATRSPNARVMQTQQEQPASLAHFDDIFVGFGDSTRRELQAGLRLGEQLAETSGLDGRRRQNIRKSRAARIPKDDNNKDPFLAEESTPTEILEKVTTSDIHTLASPSAAQIQTEVHYPTLSMRMSSMQLHNSARSDGAMSWMPARKTATQEPTPPLTQDAEPMESIRWHGANSLRGEGFGKQTESENQDLQDFSDIWQEEASRSSDGAIDTELSVASGNIGKGTAQTTDEMVLKPRRAKLPRTWRRTSGNDFSYSDESDPTDEPLPVIQDINDVAFNQAPQTGPAKFHIEPSSEDSQYSGLLYSHGRPQNQSSDKRSEPIDLSAILNAESSYIKPSSPGNLLSPHNHTHGAAIGSPSAQINEHNGASFTNSSSNLEGSRSTSQETRSISVQRSYCEYSSPIKRIAVDFGSDFEASRPNQSLAASSLLDTTLDSVARQIHCEIRAAADGEGKAEGSEFSAHETSWPTPPESDAENGETSVSSGCHERVSLIVPKRDYPSLFSAPQSRVAQKQQKEEANSGPGFFSRFWSGMPSISRNPPPPTHPLLRKFLLLPRVGPWSKTHYKTMDALYQEYKKAPDAFSPQLPQNKGILNELYQRFVDIEIQNWGYYVKLPRELIILGALCHQLCILDCEDHYKQMYGKALEPNEGVVPEDECGKPFSEKDIVLIVFSVVAGERLRKDEKKGINVDRRKGRFFVRMSGHDEWLNIG